VFDAEDVRETVKLEGTQRGVEVPTENCEEAMTRSKRAGGGCIGGSQVGRGTG